MESWRQQAVPCLLFLLLHLAAPSSASYSLSWSRVAQALGLGSAKGGPYFRPFSLEKPLADCPFPYSRWTVTDIKNGAIPYLFGGDRQPCLSCRQADIADFCQFHRPEEDKHRGFQHTAHICSEGQQAQIVRWALRMGFYDLLEATPCDLWPYLRGRTLWIVGDSQALDLYIATICFMREFWGLEEAGVRADEEALQILAQLSAKHAIDPVRCAEMPQEARICFMRINTGELLVEAGFPLLRALTSLDDSIAVVNFGLWHQDETIYRQLLSQVASQVRSRMLPLLIWKDTNPQHFDRFDGAYVDGEVGHLPFTCRPIDGVQLQRDHRLTSADPLRAQVLQGLWRNQAADDLLTPAGVPSIATFNDSVPLWNFHRSNVGRGMECGHYCHPSAPQMWVHAMFAMLREHAPPGAALPRPKRDDAHAGGRPDFAPDATWADATASELTSAAEVLPNVAHTPLHREDTLQSPAGAEHDISEQPILQATAPMPQHVIAEDMHSPAELIPHSRRAY